jgi:FkbM family methyltransferase
MTTTSFRANCIKSFITALPTRRFQATYWLTKILGPSRRFVGHFHKGKLEINPKDPASKCAFFFGFYEKETTLWFLEQVKDKKVTFLDIGANFGYFSFLTSFYANPDSTIISFEPDPNTRSWLERNKNLNKSNITIEPIAVSSGDGEVEFLSCSSDEQNALWSRIELDYTKKTAPPPGTKKIKVATTSLDLYLAKKGIKNVDILKIDVEGAEGYVIEGMKQSLIDGIYKTIFIEFHNGALPAQHTIKQMVEAIVTCGYKAYHLKASLINKESDLNPETYSMQKSNTNVLVEVNDSMKLNEISDWEHFVFVKK